MTMGELDGLAGVITGGHRGLGEQIVLAAREQGASLVAMSRSGPAAGSAGSRPPASGGIVDLKGDVTVEQDVVDAIRRCRDEFGRIDFIVNNAGILGESRLHETTNERWNQLVATHLTGSFWGCKHAIQAFLEQGHGGVIVNVGSILSFTGDGYLAAYTAMKSGVLGMTRAIAIDYAADGIRCNCVCPGDMETPMIETYFNGTGDPAAARREMLGAYPGGRMADPREVADAVVYLLSSRSSFVNGTSLVVDGGLIAKTY
jgi:NAD(P)-dependent dehydrogenase (short-subunit alcohol dehydrogenase family)